MQRFARLDADRQVAEIVEIETGTDLAGCYHPDLVAAMQAASGAVEVGWMFDGAAFHPPAPPVVDPAAEPARRRAAIEVERDRRIERDILFQGVAFQSDAKSRALIDKSRTSALSAIVAGAAAGDLRWHGLPVDFFWIASDNARMPMDAATMLAFGNASAAREGLMIVAANNLKLLVEAGETIADVADDALWPA